MGDRYGDSICLRLLRKGVNRHRWDAGVLRLGGCRAEAQHLAALAGIEWVALDRVPVQRWPMLLRRELLDGVVVNAADPLGVAWHGCQRHGLRLGTGCSAVQARRHPMIRQLLQARLGGDSVSELVA